MSFLQAVNIEEDFWRLNPEMKYMSPFNTFMTSNKDSSKIMWAIYLYTDPDSRFFRMDTEEKKNEISQNYLDGVDANFWETQEIKDLIQAYQDKILTKLQKSYLRLMKKLEDRDSFISRTSYTESNSKTLDAMLANSKSIYSQLREVENELNEEKKSGTIKGGRKESASERRVL